jgi:hypothetical protein
MKLLSLLHRSKQKNDEMEIPELYWSALKSKDYSGSFPGTARWLRQKTNLNLKPERSFSSMKNYILTHKLKLAYAVIVLAVVIGACSMPVTQNEIVGHMLTWTIPADNKSAEKDIAGLSWIDKTDLAVNENTNNGKTETLYTLMLPGSTIEQVETYMKDIERIKGVSSIKIFPLNESVKRPLYSAALYKFFRVKIDATNMSDAELKQEVTRQLQEAGVENPDVRIQTDENGRRMFKINIPEANIKSHPNDFKLKVKDGSNEEVLKRVLKNSFPEELKGKSDQEIKDWVKQNNKEFDLKDSDIQIIREDGKVKIKVVKEDVKK